MSPHRVIRSASNRPRSGPRPALWLAAATALPVVVAVVVLAALTVAVLVFGGHGLGDVAGFVAVEWLVLAHAPLAVDGLHIGFLPLLPTAILVAAVARQTRTALADLDTVDTRELVTAVAAPAVASALVTGLAGVVVGSTASDFAVRVAHPFSALAWAVATGLAGSLVGTWTFRRSALREHLPLWAIGGLHLGIGAVAATWALGAVLSTIALVGGWGPVGDALATGRDAGGITALALISLAYLPNVVLMAATVALGGEAHLGEASFNVFAVSRGHLPEVPLAAALPTTDPHPLVQVLLLATAVVAVVLSRATAHWYDSIGDAVRASLVTGGVVALATALASPVAGGRIGALGSAGTGALIAAALAFLVFGVLGAVTAALSLAGLTRRRDRDRDRLERRRAVAARRVGTSRVAAVDVDDAATDVDDAASIADGGADDAGSTADGGGAADDGAATRTTPTADDGTGDSIDAEGSADAAVDETSSPDDHVGPAGPDDPAREPRGRDGSPDGSH